MKSRMYLNPVDPSPEECTILLKRLRHGDNAAFVVIYKMYFEAVRESAQKYVTEHDSKDIALGTFSKLWEHRKKFTKKEIKNWQIVNAGKERFSTWS